MCHQEGGEASLLPGEPVAGGLFLARDAFGRIREAVAVRHGHSAGARVESRGKAAEQNSRRRDAGRKPESAHAPAKRLRQCLKEPLQRREAMLPFPRLMNLPVGARDEVFKVTAEFRLRRKSAYSRQVRR